jgi:hypothetical protein
VSGEIDSTVVLTNLLPDLHSSSFANLTFWTKGDLIQFMDEAAKRLARACMMFVERDTSNTTVNATATYALPTRHLATIHASFGTAPLRPATTIEMESRDPAFQTAPGTPDHWYEDTLGTGTIGLTPVPTTAVTLPLVCSMYPPDLDVAQVNTLLQAPAPVSGYLTFSILAGAYGRESETEQPDLAKHCQARCSLYEQLFMHYYGPGL